LHGYTTPPLAGPRPSRIIKAPAGLHQRMPLPVRCGVKLQRPWSAPRGAVVARRTPLRGKVAGVHGGAPRRAERQGSAMKASSAASRARRAGPPAAAVRTGAATAGEHGLSRACACRAAFRQMCVFANGRRPGVRCRYRLGGMILSRGTARTMEFARPIRTAIGWRFRIFCSGRERTAATIWPHTAERQENPIQISGADRHATRSNRSIRLGALARMRPWPRTTSRRPGTVSVPGRRRARAAIRSFRACGEAARLRVAAARVHVARRRARAGTVVATGVLLAAARRVAAQARRRR